MTKINLKGEKATLLPTLYGRALDSQSPDSILHDTMAYEAVQQLEFDFSLVGLRRGDDTSIALRAQHLDDWVREFLAAHPESVVLHLGCGLDTRAFRIDPGPSVQWFDVDYPEVIDLRRQLFPDRQGCEAIGSSVTDPMWLAEIKGDLPVLVVAEGLFMYLKEDEGKELVRRILDHFPSGQLVFDGLSRRGVQLQKLNKAVQAAKAKVYWGFDSCAELEAIDSRLRCVASMSAFELHNDKLPTSFRLTAKVSKVFTGMKNLAVFYRMEF
ncbi:class I SAM-dependent methyltransferase [Streptomyces zagrosensis]|uniref:O-methyltransferase involved in polyketide biosynthesis n=1 Tax=Streptomyces zagrosensis TaxID=1042984 RepID=A0A7W9UZ20_9ACTN|nr:class I SAM-dependent methyltransferase [Streptomyces zagrosensis]MBB5936570.1 O-methyltransferase involved in polyketide biosynthesis [Streptomyces zagrosensis]